MMILGIKCPDFSLQFFSNYFRSRIPWMTKDASFGSCFENQFPNWIFFSDFILASQADFGKFLG